MSKEEGRRRNGRMNKRKTEKNLWYFLFCGLYSDNEIPAKNYYNSLKADLGRI